MIPAPRAVVPGDGAFTLDPATPLAADPALAGVASWLRSVLGPATGCWLPPDTRILPDTHILPDCPTPAGSQVPHGGVVLALDPGLTPEGYRLTIGAGIRIEGCSAAGVFYGGQTLRQLLPPEVYRRAAVATGPWTVPAVTITDEPRFGWRGCLLDVARHFLPVADVLRFIDLLAVHKLNRLHLHLTDDQGWRMEIPRYPRLTEVGAWRAQSMLGSRQHGTFDGRPHGGYYTRDDLREIVAYAAARHITVVPEIDLPGHAQAAIAAYPLLGHGTAPAVRTAWGISSHVLNASDDALEFCQHVLDEVCAVFPSEVVCIGGDECVTDEWQASPIAHARMAAENLRDVADLQGWFVRRLADHLSTHGRRVSGWDEVLDADVPADTLIAAWRGPAATSAAARAGYEVVACPDTAAYLDYRQSDHPDEPTPVGTLLTLDDVYAFEPVPAGLSPEEASRVVGVQCNVWTEHLDSARALDYQVFPRLCAFAEVAWGRSDGFHSRLNAHFRRLEALGVEYRREQGPLPWQTRPDAQGWPRG